MERKRSHARLKEDIIDRRVRKREFLGTNAPVPYEQVCSLWCGVFPYIFGYSCCSTHGANVTEGNRQSVYRRDAAKKGYCVCAHCNKRIGLKWAIAHVYPKCCGGSNDANNLYVACLECNNKCGSWHPIFYELWMGNVRAIIRLTKHFANHSIATGIGLVHEQSQCKPNKVYLNKFAREHLEPNVLKGVTPEMSMNKRLVHIAQQQYTFLERKKSIE